MKQEGKTYQNIDMEQTGKKIREHIFLSGLTVREIQSYLQLSCPQPIYRWFQGRILPTVDHLYMLSILLGVHMEELLVPRMPETVRGSSLESSGSAFGRMWVYFKRIYT